jgi:ABC-type uncharacterized transport system involved in gliding motility auxiliary subunit
MRSLSTAFDQIKGGFGMIRKLLNHPSGWLIAAGIALALFIAVNAIVAPISGARLDLTEEKLHTLSDGTRNMLKKLKTPATLNFYFSKKLGSSAPAYGNYAKRVRDMLREMKLAADGKLVIRESDPVAFSETEDQAVEAGLQGAPFDQSGDQVYFGLQVKSSDTKSDEEGQVIPFFQMQRENFLEYDLARMIHAVDNPKKPVVAVYTGRPLFGDMQRMMAGMPTQAFRIVPELRKRFQVNHMFSLRDLPDEKPDVLMVIHPLALEPDEKYELDQYLLRGGKAIFIVDPFNETAAGTPAPQGRQLVFNSVVNVKDLLDRWGIEISDKVIAADRSIARMVNAGTASRILPVPFVTWLAVKGNLLSRTDPVTAELRILNFQSAGIIKVKENPAITVEPLITTSGDSQEIDTKTHKGKVNVESMAANFKPSGKKMILAARVSGTFKTLFPDGPPKPEDEKDEKADAKKKAPKKTEKPKSAEEIEKAKKEAAEKKKEEELKKAADAKQLAAHLKESKAPFNVLLVSDADLLEDHFWVQVRQFLGRSVLVPTSNNGDFIINAVDHFTGNSDLISLRSRGTTQRPFTKVDELRRDSEVKFRRVEQDLAKKLITTEKKLNELRNQQADKTKKPSEEKKNEIEAEIKTALSQLIDTRKELRNVRLKLNEDIDRLEVWVRFANIALIPILVGCFAVGLGVFRTRRRRRQLHEV